MSEVPGKDEQYFRELFVDLDGSVDDLLLDELQSRASQWVDASVTAETKRCAMALCEGCKLEVPLHGVVHVNPTPLIGGQWFCRATAIRKEPS